MLKKNLTTKSIADALGTTVVMISQLVNGHYYYPRYAQEIERRYGIHIPDSRRLRRARQQAA